MIKYILVFLILGIPLAAQESDNQSIELPDFVITGTQNITIPEARKEKPKLFQALSQEFFKPSFTPDQLNISKFSDPLRKDYSSFEKGNFNSGLLILGAGLETLPTGNFYFTQSAQPVMFNAHIYGKNINEYRNNAGYNISGVEGNLNLFTSTKASLLPGLKISLEGHYNRDNYKLFGSNTPGYKRENEIIESSIGFESGLNDQFKYSLNGRYETLKLIDTDYVERLIKGDARIQSNFGKFGFSVAADVTNQLLRNNAATEDSYLYYSGNASFHINTVETFNVKLGVHYSKLDSVDLLSTIASFDLKLDDGIMFYGEYAPHTKFHHTKSFLESNRYYQPLTSDNILTKYSTFIKLAFEFQYRKFFEISVGASFAQIDNVPYFDDSVSKGVFDFGTSDDVNYFNAFVNAKFHSSVLGYLYFDAYFNRLRTDDNFSVPYRPMFDVGINYGYQIFTCLELGTQLQYLGKFYTDIANTNSINSYVDLALFAKYNLLSQLDFTTELNNILNKKNYIYKNYLEKPFDIIVGIEYRW